MRYKKEGTVLRQAKGRIGQEEVTKKQKEKKRRQRNEGVSERKRSIAKAQKKSNKTEGYQKRRHEKQRIRQLKGGNRDNTT